MGEFEQILYGFPFCSEFRLKKIQIIALKRHCFVNVLAFRQRLCLLLKVAKFSRYLLSIMFHGICYMLGIQRQGSWSQDTYCVRMDVTQ